MKRITKDFEDLFRDLGIVPKDERLYKAAFTHSSYNGMAGSDHHDYERLEFLGDSIIGMVVSELCFEHHPSMDQGKLSILKAQFIKSQSEAEYCKKLNLVDYIRVGTSFQGSVANTTAILEDVFEAFVGALFLDQGLECVHGFLVKLFEEDIKNGRIEASQNPKSTLQETMQAKYKKSVEYKTLKEEGPANDRVFTAAVYFEGKEIGRGRGKSKKEAEVAAAAAALAKITGK